MPYLNETGLSHVISKIKAALSGKADSSHTHDGRYYTETEVDNLLAGKASTTHDHDGDYDALGAADTALASAKTHSNSNLATAKSYSDTNLATAKSYADSAATTAATKVKNDLLNGAGTAYDTLKELGDLIDDNQDAIAALETVAGGKADAEHTHAIADVSGLQSALDGKAAKSHGTHVTYSTTAPAMDGTASVGSASNVARGDHVHPTDTTRAAQADLDALEEVVAGKAAASSLTSHTGNKSNPHGVTKSQVGLGNVPNVATNDQTPTYTEATSAAALTSGEKLSVAMGKIAKAVSTLISHVANKSNPHGVTASQVGLGNVNNTSDANKPVSTAQATAIADAKAAGTTAQSNLSSHTSNKSNPHGVTLAQLGVTASASAVNDAAGLTALTNDEIDDLWEA